VFGLEGTRLIDPTCGSGHFLLAAFDRLYRKWQDREPDGSPRVLAQRALDAVCGVDLNPFAVAIARFRLLLAALAMCEIGRLKDAPDFHFELAVGDSLLHGRLLGRERAVQRGLLHDPSECFYASEDEVALKRILGRRYQAVVGNPPYIPVEDDTLRATYRTRFGTCFGGFQLSVPFIERFFNLTLRAEAVGAGSAGFVGLLVSSAFMKRDFGKRLVEDYLRYWDLTHVIDTSGAHLANHGTPTVLLFGRNRPATSPTIRAVRGICGEDSAPADPETGLVWGAITRQVDAPGSESRWVSVTDVPSDLFRKHPWPMGGGGAAELRVLLDSRSQRRLVDVVKDVGRTAALGEEDAWPLGESAAHRRCAGELARALVAGEDVREWSVTPSQIVPYPYRELGGSPLAHLDGCLARRLWPARPILANRKIFGRTLLERGRPWFELLEHYGSRLRSPSSIAFGEIVTHNNFAFDCSQSVFNRTAPVIKLNESSTKDDHIAVLGVLNSSVAGFWFKQMCHSKGARGIGGGLCTEPWEQFMCLNTGSVEQFPLPTTIPLEIARLIQAEAEARAELMPDRLCAGQTPTASVLLNARNRAAEHLARMIALQEELDWKTYHLYGLLQEDPSLSPDQVPPLQLGERPFEIGMARRMAADEVQTAWFLRHRSVPITDLPPHWPEHYRQTIERRIEIIRSNRDIALIEAPEYKRRWNLPPWEELEERALESWLLDRMEACALWQEPELKTCARLADLLRRDADFVSVGALYRGQQDFDITVLVTELVMKQAVPFLAVLRYNESGMRKRAIWEEVWALQRREDAGEKIEIPAPPKYTKADFLNGPAWSLRGSLDVPKERFILYSHLQREADSTPVLGWAGWDHLAQAKALAAYYAYVKEEDDWSVDRLKPVLAGISELVPWLKQWHNDPDPGTGSQMGDAFEMYIETECQALGFPDRKSTRLNSSHRL